MLTAGPPTPAVTLISPLTAPETSHAPGKDADERPGHQDAPASPVDLPPEPGQDCGAGQCGTDIHHEDAGEATDHQNQGGRGDQRETHAGDALRHRPDGTGGVIGLAWPVLVALVLLSLLGALIAWVSVRGTPHLLRPTV
ncbi:hypothetical protein [Ornithinimicrobium sp.]|uniref:hypothetical protein n=1 Tax=Ornithinimicrobium sp. TaxID=1977084 RepID=UPI003D9B6475